VPVDYFPRPSEDCPTFVDDTEWHPLVDGEEYFAELDEALRDLDVGDSVLIGGLGLDPALDLHGRSPGDDGYLALGERLAQAAQAGVTVRVLLAGRVLASSIPWSGLGDFRANAERAARLRAWRPAGSSSTPLAGRVLVDFGGSFAGSNHQKVVVISRGGRLTAFVGGIDLQNNRYDAAPHDRLKLRGARWGWHDMAVRLRGPAAERVWELVATRWQEASTLPRKRYLRDPLHLQQLNPGAFANTPADPPAQPPLIREGTAVRVLRSMAARKFESLVPGRSIGWDALPSTGYQEIFETLTTAIAAAQRYVYVEDQYLGEELGGRKRFELYPHLRAAAGRGVRVILVGSGVRDPEDAGVHLRPINRSLNPDLRTKIVDLLDDAHRANVAVYRVEHATVHAKVVLVDDVFACIGSANMFARSMGGVDCELSAAVQTSTSLVRDLRVRLWGEHLRTPLTDEVRSALGDLELALGIWDERWLPPAAPPVTWRKTGEPLGFAPEESVLRRVPDRRGTADR